MGIRRNRLLTAGLSAAIVVLAMSGTGIQASASSVPGPNFSTPQGIDAYLQSRGVNPAAAIRQTGLKNYVGTRCPGTGWHCIAPTHTPVVQIASAGGVNVFTCSPGTRGRGSCFVLQINAGASAAGSAPRTSPGAVPAGDLLAGTNAAQFTCNQASSANPAILDCGTLAQVNTTGANLATIAQTTTQQQAEPQSAMETAGSSPAAPLSQTNVSGNNQITITQRSFQNSSDTPTAAQTANVSQVNGTGQNQATVSQLEQQQVSDAAATQDQEGTQVACVTQDSPSGPNVATVSQVMAQAEHDSASGIIQRQNQSQALTNSTCGTTNPSSTSAFPNLAALVLQNQNPLLSAGATGQNKQTIKQSLFQQEHSSTPSGAVTQQQGTPDQTDLGGLEAIPDQTSTALSTLTTSQGEQQHMQASTTGALSQNQADPLRQPPGEGLQGSNPNDTFTLTQSGVQQASPFPPLSSSQVFDIEGDCTTSGTCNVQSTDTSNGVTQSNSCGPTSPCFTFVANEGG